tara:strand:+ start:592 stop:1176 length:585 start_codon:yes stop_codon:yes gene_type:complete
MAKYWLAGNPNAVITDAEVKELATISETDFGVLSDLTVTANELNRTTAVNTSVTALAAAGALAANTTYHVTDTDTAAYTLPAAASSTVGDRINVIYIAVLGNTGVHKYGTADEFFADTSFVMVPSNATHNSAYTVDVADGTGDDFLNLTGATDAGWGIGTRLTFVFNGSKWHVECWGKATGNGSTGATGSFGTS